MALFFEIISLIYFKVTWLFSPSVDRNKLKKNKSSADITL